jgi:YD repeat-containing protein
MSPSIRHPVRLPIGAKDDNAFRIIGNTTSDGGRTFTYNDAGRMSTYTKAGVTTTETYNGLGQRVTKSNAAGTHYFVYDESGHLLGEYDAAGNLFQETVWMGDIPIAALWSNGAGGVTVTYIHTVSGNPAAFFSGAIKSRTMAPVFTTGASDAEDEADQARRGDMADAVVAASDQRAVGAGVLSRRAGERPGVSAVAHEAAGC